MSSSSLRLFPKNGGGGGGGDGYCAGAGAALLEVTVLSAESLRLPPSYSPLPRRLRPYVTVSSGASPDRCYSTAVASSSSGAGGEHSWGDTVVVPVDAEFLEDRTNVHVSVLSEATCPLVGGDTLLGWCGVPVTDVLDGLRAPRALRRLSYSLRCPRRGGGGQQQRAPAVVHLAVRVLGHDDARLGAPPPLATPQQQGWCRVAMGIPVSGATSAAAAVVGTPCPWGSR